MTRRTVLAACLVLAACGGKSSETGEGKVEVATAAGSGVTAVPAGAQPPKIDCGRVKGQTAPEGRPTDDILGIRHGMTLEHVRAVLTCTNKTYVLAESDQMAGPAGLPSSRRVTLNADGGLDKFRGDFAGPQGEETLIRAERTLEYAADSEPLMSVIATSLEEKYGTFDTKPNSGSAPQNGSIVYSPDGQRMGSGNSDYNPCIYGTRSYYQNVSNMKNCGVVVTYSIQPKQDNPTLAQSFKVVVMNQGAAMREMKAADDTAAARANAAAVEAAERGEGPKL